MKGAWWKMLAIFLVSYSFIIGNIIPLRPGIISNKTDLTLELGRKNSLVVTTYNSRYAQEAAGTVQARLRISPGSAYCASDIQVLNDRQVQLTFDLPMLNTGDIQPPFPLLEIGSSQGRVFTAVPLKKAAVPDSSLVAKPCGAEPYAEAQGLTYPFLNILEETIRNLFFHVPMWFGMMLLLTVSVVYSIRALRRPQEISHDIAAHSFASVGLLYGFLGITTGAMWAAFTWGTPWSWDVKQNTAAVALLIYMAYFVLRGSIEDADKKARISAIYNIFAFAALFPLLYIIPRMADSMHPGAQGNPGFNTYDLDSNMRLVFYPAVLGWILLGVWIATLLWRMRLVEERDEER